MPMPRYVAILALLALAAAGPVRSASTDSLAVDVTNTSEPVLCAEKDNVAINFASPEVTSFRIEAAHPAYMGTLREDRWEPDWTACDDISEETSRSAPPIQTTIFESPDLRLVGLTFETFWRPRDVTFRVGDEPRRNIHMVQLWVRHKDRMEEVLVLYPADGYWRIRPLPPEHLGRNAYGSSFLVGPVEFDQRPVVNISDVAFDPLSKAFSLTFGDGSKGTVAIKDLTSESFNLDIAFDRPIGGNPFAALRSMYVTEFNADVARIAAREEQAKFWREETIMGFRSARATDVWMGRLTPSRHNTSAPDMVFKAFRGQGTTP
jgi:hypothetical protein